MKYLLMAVLSLILASCGTVYRTPKVVEGAAGGANVRVLDMNPETVIQANRSPYSPKTLPAFFSQASSGGAFSTPAARPAALATRLPPKVNPGPYEIGVGDVVLLATPQAQSSVEQLSGLLAAQNARQGYTVQDDGAINIPNVGRVRIAGLTIEDAEVVLFQRLVENQLDPIFSLEISEFNSRKVSIGGAVAQPTVIPVTLSPLFLEEALAAAGGITVEDQDYAAIRLYRDGTMYQIPLNQLYSRVSLTKTRLLPGDSVFVDTEYDLSQARENYQARIELGVDDRQYVYLAGEVGKQSRFALPFEGKASLADAMYESDGIASLTGDVSQIYVLRSSSDPREFGAITAWHLDARSAANFALAPRFELRPDDIIFVAQQPVTRWSRAVSQILPQILSLGTSLTD
ncbi:MAG: polysaccharide export outer membrane protein [Akkermansiaceae bacterium]